MIYIFLRYEIYHGVLSILKDILHLDDVVILLLQLMKNYIYLEVLITQDLLKVIS